jgi:Fic family protein
MARYIWQYDSWPSFHWTSEALLVPLANARRAQGMLLGQAEGLGLDLRRRARGEILVEESLRTSEIEGERLDETGVRSSVARRLGLPTAGLPQPGAREQGVVDMLLDAAEHLGEPLTADRVKGWQAALFPTGYSGLRPVKVGQWRGVEPMQVVSGPIGHEVVHYQAPPGDRVDGEMQRFLAWWNKPPAGLDGMLRAGLAHLWFVAIHPFEDGNGRVARAITDLALAEDERSAGRLYSVSASILKTREAYYAALGSASCGGGDVTSWLAWFLTTLETAIAGATGVFGHVLDLDRFWRRAATVSLVDRQRKVLGRLLEAGPGGFEGRLTTRKYVALTGASRATAYREIHDLVQRGLLRPTQHGGRSARYEVAWE